jgi:hypothetical protein
MSTEGHKAAMQADYSPTLDESIDPPLYTPDFAEGFINGLAVVGWAILWFATIAVACGGAAWAGSALLEWMEPHWPVLVGMLS